MSCNLRLSWLLTALMMFAALCLSGCGGKASREASHMERAKSYFAMAEHDKARVELRNVLQINPRNSAAFCLLGQVYERQEDRSKAFAQFSKAVEVSPENLEARTRLGRTYLLFGDSAKAKEQVQFVLARAPDDAAGRILNSAILARGGNTQGAIDEVRAVLAKHPADEDAASTLAGIFAKQSEYAKAEQVLAEALKQGSKSVMLRLNLVDVLAHQKKREGIEPLLRDLVAMEPKKFAHNYRLAAFYATSNRVAAAEKVLRDAIAANEDDEQRYLALAQLIAEKRDVRQAEQELQRVIRQRPRANRVRLGLAALYERTGHPEMAEEAYRETIELLKSGPERLVSQISLAKLLLARGALTESDRIISEILKDSPRDTGALLTRGRIALERNDPRSAIADFRSGLRDQPGSIEILSLLGQAHLLNHEQELARENFSKAVELNPTNPQAKLLLMDFLARSGDFDGALTEVNELLKTAPLDTALLQRKAMLLSSKKDKRGAEESLAKLKEAAPDQVVGYCRMGSFYLSEKRFNEAAAEFEAALRKEPSATDPLLGLVQSYLAQGRADKATARLREVSQSLPRHPTAHILLAQALEAEGKGAEAERAYKDAIALRPEWRVPYIGLADLFLKRKDYSSAIRTLEIGLKGIPDDALLQITLAHAHEEAGDYDRAVPAYESVLKTDPSMDIAANNLASLLTDRRGDKASLERALVLARRFEDSRNPAFLDTLGWTYVKLGQPARGRTLLEKVVARAPDVAVFRYHLGVAHYDSGDLGAAKTNLQVATSIGKEYAGLEEVQTLMKKLSSQHSADGIGAEGERVRAKATP